MVKLFFIALSSLFLSHCGDEGKKAPKVDNSSEFNNEIKPLVQEYCKRCHEQAGFVNSETAFKSDGVYNKIKSRQMPKAGSPEATKISEETRSKMIAFIEKKPAQQPSRNPY